MLQRDCNRVARMSEDEKNLVLYGLLLSVYEMTLVGPRVMEMGPVMKTINIIIDYVDAMASVGQRLNERNREMYISIRDFLGDNHRRLSNDRRRGYARGY